MKRPAQRNLKFLFSKNALTFLAISIVALIFWLIYKLKIFHKKYNSRFVISKRVTVCKKIIREFLSGSLKFFIGHQ